MNTTGTPIAKRLARLAAVQALYQSSYEQQLPAQIIRDSVDGEFPGLSDDDSAALPEAPDKALFGKIVEGVTIRQKDLDAMIAGALDERLASKQFERLLQTILRAGAFELHQHGDTPAGAIINDYVDVAHAFYNGREPGLVNGILDKLAANLRQG
jgi:transcription antitermination protein NusB